MGTSLDLDFLVTPRPSHAIRKLRLALLFTPCLLSPRWQQWGRLVAREQAAAYCKDIQKVEGYQAWIIGIVEKGNRTARIIDKPRVIEVPAKEKEGELW